MTEVQCKQKEEEELLLDVNNFTEEQKSLRTVSPSSRGNLLSQIPAREHEKHILPSINELRQNHGTLENSRKPLAFPASQSVGTMDYTKKMDEEMNNLIVHSKSAALKRTKSEGNSSRKATDAREARRVRAELLKLKRFGKPPKTELKEEWEMIVEQSTEQQTPRKKRNEAQTEEQKQAILIRKRATVQRCRAKKNLLQAALRDEREETLKEHKSFHDAMPNIFSILQEMQPGLDDDDDAVSEELMDAALNPTGLIRPGSDSGSNSVKDSTKPSN